MSTYYYHGPALDSEIAYRRDSMLRDAAAARLARQARRARRAGARTATPVRPVPAGEPVAVTAAAQDQVTRAA